MRYLCFLSLLCLMFSAEAQKNTYRDSLKRYQQNYVSTHEVVGEADRKFFSFYPVSEKYRVTAVFEKLQDSNGFIMKTSGTKSKKYFRYGLLRFTINQKPLQLTVYQSEQLMADSQYRNYLFVPFTDLSSGEKSYGGGRYIDLMIEDVKDKKVILDFNKAYNPYCAYATGYNCPIPPRENDLPVIIKAGEMDFGKTH